LFKVFGESEFLARFVSALAGVGCVVVCYLTAKHLRDRTTGLIGCDPRQYSSLCV